MTKIVVLTGAKAQEYIKDFFAKDENAKDDRAADIKAQEFSEGVFKEMLKSGLADRSAFKDILTDEECDRLAERALDGAKFKECPYCSPKTKREEPAPSPYSYKDVKDKEAFRSAKERFQEDMPYMRVSRDIPANAANAANAANNDAKAAEWAVDILGDFGIRYDPKTGRSERMNKAARAEWFMKRFPLF